MVGPPVAVLPAAEHVQLGDRTLGELLDERLDVSALDRFADAHSPTFAPGAVVDMCGASSVRMPPLGVIEPIGHELERKLRTSEVRVALARMMDACAPTFDHGSAVDMCNVRRLHAPRTLVDGVPMDDLLAAKADACAPTFVGTMYLPEASGVSVGGRPLCDLVGERAPAHSPTFTGALRLPDTSEVHAGGEQLASALSHAAPVDNAVLTGVVHLPHAQHVRFGGGATLDDLVPDGRTKASAHDACFTGSLTLPPPGAVRIGRDSAASAPPTLGAMLEAKAYSRELDALAPVTDALFAGPLDLPDATHVDISGVPLHALLNAKLRVGDPLARLSAVNVTGSMHVPSMERVYLGGGVPGCTLADALSACAPAHDATFDGTTKLGAGSSLDVRGASCVTLPAGRTYAADMQALRVQADASRRGRFVVTFPTPLPDASYMVLVAHGVRRMACGTSDRTPGSFALEFDGGGDLPAGIDALELRLLVLRGGTAVARLRHHGGVV